MQKIEHSIENGIAYTFINGTRGTLNHVDALTILDASTRMPDGGVYLETGSYLGCSALIAALHSTCTVYAHDIWVTDWSELRGAPPPEVKDYFYEFYATVKSNQMVGRIIPIRGNSAYTVGIHDNFSVDLAFVDGDHSYQGCLDDLNAVFPKMRLISEILIHDCIVESEPLAAVFDFCSKNDLEFNVIPSSWGMAHIKLNRPAQ